MNKINVGDYAGLVMTWDDLNEGDTFFPCVENKISRDQYVDTLYLYTKVNNYRAEFMFGTTKLDRNFLATGMVYLVDRYVAPPPKPEVAPQTKRFDYPEVKYKNYGPWFVGMSLIIMLLLVIVVCLIIRIVQLQG